MDMGYIEDMGNEPDTNATDTPYGYTNIYGNANPGMIHHSLSAQRESFSEDPVLLQEVHRVISHISITMELFQKLKPELVLAPSSHIATARYYMQLFLQEVQKAVSPSLQHRKSNGVSTANQHSTGRPLVQSFPQHFPHQQSLPHLQSQQKLNRQQGGVGQSPSTGHTDPNIMPSQQLHQQHLPPGVPHATSPQISQGPSSPQGQSQISQSLLPQQLPARGQPLQQIPSQLQPTPPQQPQSFQLMHHFYQGPLFGPETVNNNSGTDEYETDDAPEDSLYDNSNNNNFMNNSDDVVMSPIDISSIEPSSPREEINSETEFMWEGEKRRKQDASSKPYNANIRVFKVNPSKSRAHRPIVAPHRNPGKVPSSLSNTSASTMMYQFNLKPKNRKTKKAAIATGPPSYPITLTDFEFLKVLGIGTYGKVQLARYKPENTYYCVKILSRYTIFRHKQIEHVQNEKNVLNSVRHPGIVRLFGTTSDTENLYLLMEYVPGGELFTYIRKFGKLSFTTVRFYVAELVLVLEYLHGRNLIYRDLKPENILLDADGHVKLTDFGFSKMVTDKTWTMCGTPDYLAPEVISGQGHGKAVDWWSLGVLVFEMLAGYPPFTDENTMALFDKIREPYNLIYPESFIPEAVDLIKKLLVIDPTRRLGVTRNGVMEIKLHPFFNGLDWQGAAERKTPPPLKPKVKGPDDTSNYNLSGESFGTSALNDVPLSERGVPVPDEISYIFDTF